MMQRKETASEVSRQIKSWCDLSVRARQVIWKLAWNDKSIEEISFGDKPPACCCRALHPPRRVTLRLCSARLRSDWEKWAWNNEDTLAVALHFVFCPHARHSTTKVTTSRCCGKITRRESICWQLAPREELSLLSCQIHSHQLRGYCQHSLLRNCCAKLAAYTQSHSPSICTVVPLLLMYTFKHLSRHSSVKI